MSIDTFNEPRTGRSLDVPVAWESLLRQVQKNARRWRSDSIFGAAAKGGSVYRWGLAVSKSSECDSVTVAVSRLAAGGRFDVKLREEVDLLAAAESFVQWLRTTTELTAADGAAVVMWAAALPALADELEPVIWYELYQALTQIREAFLLQHDVSAVNHLTIGVELGLTLAWRCAGDPGTKGLKGSAVNELYVWCEQQSESVSDCLKSPLDVRLILASLVRCKRLMRAISKRRWTKKMNRIGVLLTTWVSALMMHTGSSAFSSATRKQVKDDLGANGLLAAAEEFDPESLSDVMQAALGKTPVGGRLTWQANLPETLHHDADAKLAVMFPDWDVRRGRTHVDYSAEEVQLEVFSGRTRVIGGTWQTMIETESGEQRPDGPWMEICEYSDDDVHYLEIEQPWTGGLLLQRQFMLIRDDRCLMLADSIIPQEFQPVLPGTLKYRCRLPLVTSIQLVPESETREAFLSDRRKRGLVIPLSASEWTISRCEVAMEQTDDRRMTYSAIGRNRLYAPIWFDFQQRRFNRKRTWRKLTIADRLRLVGSDEAVGYRVQIGAEQWVVYRSLGERVCRSFLGKHLIADFFCARFDPEDGGHEALVTVDDHDQSE